VQSTTKDKSDVRMV